MAPMSNSVSKTYSAWGQ